MSRILHGNSSSFYAANAGISDENLQKLVKHAQIPHDEIATILNMQHLGVPVVVEVYCEPPLISMHQHLLFPLSRKRKRRQGLSAESVPGWRRTASLVGYPSSRTLWRYCRPFAICAFTEEMYYRTASKEN